MSKKNNASEAMLELCQEIGISQVILSNIIGKTQKIISEKFKNDTFTTVELFKIVDALNCGIEFSIDGTAATNHDELYDLFLSEANKRGYSNKELAKVMEVTLQTYTSRMQAKDFKTKLLIQALTAMGCKVEIDIDSSGAMDKEEIYQEYYKSPLSEEGREKKNARQREYAKRTGYASNQKYNKKAYTRLSFDEKKDIAEAYKEKCKELNIPYAQPLHEAVMRILGDPKSENVLLVEE